MPSLDPHAIEQLFTHARTFQSWLDQPIDDALLQRLYELACQGPTSSNTSPMRVVFVKSAAAKEKLRPALNATNVDKTMQAAATAIVAVDTEFWQQMPTLMPGRDLKGRFEQLAPELKTRMSTQSANLEAAYLILAARALGLDCGPMGGFDPAKVDEAFLAGTSWKSVLLINLGYGDRAKLAPRNPRLPFAQAARIE